MLTFCGPTQTCQLLPINRQIYRFRPNLPILQSVVFVSTDFIKCAGFTASCLFSTYLRKIPTAAVNPSRTSIFVGSQTCKLPASLRDHPQIVLFFQIHPSKPRSKALAPILTRKSAISFHRTSAISVRFRRFDIVTGSLHIAQTMTISESRIVPFFDVFQECDRTNEMRSKLKKE